ncbi:MAG: pilus assembly PilX N-terminal domain-containing protein [Pseudomonadota bacterium]
MIISTRMQAMLVHTRARGVSLVTAIFLVVVLAGLTAAIVRVTLVQSATASMDMLGVQAYQAARSGLEWGIYQQLRLKPPAVDCFASPKTFAMPADGGLRNFTVTVSCTAKSGNAVGDTTNRWTIVAVACNDPAGCPSATTNVDYVQRRVQAELN